MRLAHAVLPMTLCYCGDHSAISARRNVVVVIKSRNCDKAESAVRRGNDIRIAPRAATLGFCPIADPKRIQPIADGKAATSKRTRIPSLTSCERTISVMRRSTCVQDCQHWPLRYDGGS